jgi:hypothetical protein
VIRSGPIILLLALAGAAHAEPRFALREGVRCGHCHVNRTGGGMRTPFGVSFSQSNLSTWRAEGAFDPYAGESLAFGANMRLSNQTRLGTTTSIGGIERDAETTNTFAMTEGNLYLRAEVAPDRFTVYLDQTVAPEGASAREAFLLIEALPGGVYVKAGRFLLPYGLRVPDDASFMREQTGFTYANQDLGVEIGVALSDRVQASLAVTNGSLGGSDPNTSKQVTGTLEHAFGPVRLGLSGAYNDSSEDEDFELTTLTAGAHLGLRLGRMVLLGAFDWIRNSGDGETSDAHSVYGELDFEVLKGLHARAVFESFDPDWEADENERDRFIFGLSWFPMQMLEVRAAYRMNRDIPQRIEGNVDALLFELHGFL